MAYGLLSTGYLPEPLAALVADLEADFQAAFGADFDLSAEGPAGQFIGILAERLATVWQLGGAVYNAGYPDTASGSALDDLCAITGCFRLPATKSTDVVVGIGTNGTVLAPGLALKTGANGNSFASSASATIATLSAWAGGGSYSAFSSIAVGALVTNAGNIYACTAAIAVATSAPTGTGASIADGTGTWRYIGAGSAAAGILVLGAATGPLTAPAGTITTISTPVVGLTSVSNPIDAVPGTNIETDAALRIRRAASLQQSGTAPVQALRAALLQVSGVTAAYAYENPTDAVDGSGRPPHSVECLVQGGTDAAVAMAIWNAKAAGIASTGGSIETVTDPVTGAAYSVWLSRPVVTPIYVEVTVKKGSTYATGGVGAAAVKAAIVAYANGLVSALGGTAYTVGQTVYAGPLAAAVLDALPPPYLLDVTSLFIGTSPGPTTSTPLTMLYSQLPDFQTANITVIET
jgi:uncharacterized phage protein gp47/JayE